MKESVRKEEVEELLGNRITDGQFAQALEYARRKQEYIFCRERREIVKQHWYLVRLVAEYVGILAFQNFTMDLCRMMQDMEKEHSVKETSAPSEQPYCSISCAANQAENAKTSIWRN